MRKLARLHSIQLAFRDTLKRRRIAAEETLLALLAARGVSVGNESDCRELILQRLDELTARALPPSMVVWTDDGRGELVIYKPPGSIARLKNENGDPLEALPGVNGSHSDHLSIGQAQAGQPHHTQVRFGPLPIGYYTLALEIEGRAERCWIAVAPRRAFEREERRFGAFAPAYAIRSERSTSIADLRDVGNLAATLAGVGASVLGTLPMLASYLDHVSFEPSPYAAVSRLFWNELFVDLEALPELSPERVAQLRSFLQSDAAQELRGARMVDYATEAAWRSEFLGDAGESFFRSADVVRGEQFERFLREHPLARRYAEFRAATAHFGSTWPSWSEPARSGDLRGVALPRETVHFHLYAQFVMHEQMAALASRTAAEGCGLFLDFPLGSNAHGFDVWNERNLFIRSAAIGAPPDLSYPQGQNWGFRPADPDEMRRSGYEHWIACIRHQLKCSGMLRLDHVMGLHRLYVIPDGFGAEEGAYLKYPAEDFYAILSIESHRHSAEIVGEDLGTVPPVVRHAMREHAIKGLYVVQRQLLHGEVVPPDALGEVVASLNNHDMPPFRAFWEGSDIPEKLRLGVIAESRHGHELDKRERARVRLREHLVAFGLLTDDEHDVDAIVRAATRYLGSSGAGLVMVTLEDLWLESESQNIPTTSTERPNWRYRFIDAIETLLLQPDVRERLKAAKR